MCSEILLHNSCYSEKSGYKMEDIIGFPPLYLYQNAFLFFRPKICSILKPHCVQFLPPCQLFKFPEKNPVLTKNGKKNT